MQDDELMLENDGGHMMMFAASFLKKCSSQITAVTHSLR
jgi:hypothetical protein